MQQTWPEKRTQKNVPRVTPVTTEVEDEAVVLVDRLDTFVHYKNITWNKMEIGSDKTKVMIKSPNGYQREIKIKGRRLEAVEKIKYLGSIISNDGSKPEIFSRIAQTIAALSGLKIILEEQEHFACF